MGKKARERTRRARGKASLGSRAPMWLLVAVVAVVVLGAIVVWQSASGGEPAPSRSENPAALLPLVEAGLPLRGEHNPRAIPLTSPTPASVAEDAPGPRLDLPTRSHDFGRIPRRGKVSHIFAVQNVGTSDLVVRNLVTSCGCTVAELSSRVIPPGRRADLLVTFDPDYHETRGPVVRVVWFATNDPAHPWVEVRITADVEG